ncbi:hypothetical protein BDY19DRAFT_379589 [Irpex rosettiformis]|uniref:Uncharacterized protein n=1 Tax=Irpex rosettiformis TaxID=378272 RepID=A0ACB8TVS9_9APHY|nr:hypothetical protein BDY19DRAFT_379589 [Irpex rosettiformis]
MDHQVELMQGTCVPQVSMFAPQDQMHGEIILQLKRRWPCQTHSNESGGPGWCFVPLASGLHYGLNMPKLKAWAIAIASHQHTIEQPPSMVLDGGPREGGAIKARGRAGPYGAAFPSQTASANGRLAREHNMVYSKPATKRGTGQYSYNRRRWPSYLDRAEGCNIRAP